MIIKKEIYEKLLQCPHVPPEVGGILGGNNFIIDNVIVDNGKAVNAGIKYVPDVTFINQHILMWHNSGIDLYGIFHTHSKQWMTLSGGDKKYIEIIMKFMPDEITSLLFPLVFPGYTVKAFRAVKEYEKVYMIEEKIKII